MCYENDNGTDGWVDQSLEQKGIRINKTDAINLLLTVRPGSKGGGGVMGRTIPRSRSIKGPRANI